MIAVVVSLVAVVLLVLVVVALGMRSMNRRESALPAERLREMAEKEAQTPTTSIDDFATREPKMNHFSPDLTPFDEPKPPRPPRPAGSRGKRGVNEFGQADDYDDDYWTRLQADEGGFGGSLAARMGASRPVGEDGPPRADAEATMQVPLPNRSQTPRADADAVTVQAPLPNRTPPSRPPAAPAPAVASSSLPSGLADLVGPVQPEPAPTTAALAEQKTVTFAAPTPGAFGEGRAPRPNTPRSRRSSRGSASGGAPGKGTPSRPDPLSDPLGGSYPRGTGPVASSGSMPARGATGGPLGPEAGAGPLPPMPPMGPTTSGGFPASPSADPLAAPYGAAPEPPRPVSDNPWAQATAPGSGGWPAANTADILDDPAPSYSSYQTPVYSAPPAASYEVSSGWATIDDDALTGPTPALSTPTGPSRSVSPYDDRTAEARPGPGYGYDPAQRATPAAPAAWPEPASGGGDGANAAWPSYGDLYGTGPTGSAAVPEDQGRGSRGNHHRAQEPDYPDYYR
ncbi:MULTISPECIES: hypothetical protein [Streptosporangium]|uniref:Uncharacterized protein n=1 Tax=Streptosporangium brasiliense TaxID=47480 RepID=A0ABT9RBR9_9ACTN|nr:hypothetical protein [Streptosporangium brasiliense]MDP9866588.1 hypothetical protein [Streptosporangium brasiliense]